MVLKKWLNSCACGLWVTSSWLIGNAFLSCRETTGAIQTKRHVHESERLCHVFGRKYTNESMRAQSALTHQHGSFGVGSVIRFPVLSGFRASGAYRSTFPPESCKSHLAQKVANHTWTVPSEDTEPSRAPTTRPSCSLRRVWWSSTWNITTWRQIQLLSVSTSFGHVPCSLSAITTGRLCRGYFSRRNEL